MSTLPILMGYVVKITRLLTTLGRLDVLLCEPSTAVDLGHFVMVAMQLKDFFLYLLVRVGQCDRLVGSMTQQQSFSVWAVTSTHQSRSESAFVYHKMINMRLLSEGVDGVWSPKLSTPC